MCSRYELFCSEENHEMNKIIELAVSNSSPDQHYNTTGEIFPSNAAPIIAVSSKRITPEFFVWGFPGFQKKELIINARSETAAQKPTFKQALIQRRCVVPSTGFYEWSHDSQKKKYKFNLPEQENLYMAGIWNEYDGQKRFVILTTAANRSMEPIHNRMPLILPKELIRSWINDTNMALSLLSQMPPELSLVNADPFEQLTL